MTRGRVIGVLALVALLALGAWISRRVTWEEISVPMPLRGEARTNRFYSAQRLIESLGARSEHRRALGSLPAHDAVIFLTGWHWGLIESHRAQLEAWVSAGGRLVLDSALLGGEAELYDWTGLSREFPAPEESEDEAEAEAEAAEQAVEPEAPTCVDNCEQLEVLQGDSALIPVGGVFRLCSAYPVGWLTSEEAPVWALTNADGLQAVRVRIGRGAVTFLNAAPFNNLQLLETDHARLLVDALQLRRGDYVVFATQEEHASLLALIWNHGAPVVIVLALLIGAALWRGSVRFGPMQAEPDLSRRSLAEQIRGTGQFVVRTGGGETLHAAMVRALHEAAQRRIPNYSRMPIAERITAISAVTGVDPEELGSHIYTHRTRSAHELKRAIGQLEHARARLE